MAGAEFGSVSGLARVLENPRYPIARACAAVSNCLDLSRDNYRPFFEQSFPQLLRRVFGYDGSSWLTALAQDGKPAEVSALLDMLSPTGKLFAAMHAVDTDALIKYHFPTERLPTYTQVLLGTASGRAVLNSWPQYSGGAVGADSTGRPHVHLGVFRYFLAWFAFYVLRGGTADGIGGNSSSSPGQHQTYAALTNSVLKAANSLRVPGSRLPGSCGGNDKPFLKLLRAYQDHFLPRPLPGVPSLQGNSGSRAGASAQQSTGEVFYSVLVEWWLTDGEEPLPLPQGAPLQAGGTVSGTTHSATAQPLRSLTYEAPSAELLEALVVLVRYATVFDGSSDPRPAQGATPWLPLPPVAESPPGLAGRPSRRPPPQLGAAGAPSTQALGRRVYRLLKRALSFWPEQRPVDPVYTLWLSLLAPWAQPLPSSGSAQQAACAGSGTLRQLSRAGSLLVPSAVMHGSDTNAVGNAASHQHQMTGRYDSRAWQAHVLAHLPLAGVLVPLAAEAAASRARSRPHEAAACMQRVLDVFSAAAELTDTLQAVEEAAERCGFSGGATTPRRRPDGPFAELLPWAAEQVADWEAAASSDPSGASHPDDVPPELSMFMTDARGAAPWVAAVIRTTEGGAPPALLDALRDSAQAVLPMDRIDAEPEPQPEVQPIPAAALPQGLKRGHWSDVRYRGDPLERPIASYELAPLARVAVRGSRALNRRLRLDTPITADEPAPEGWLQTAMLFARRRGWRVNLRPLAEWRALLFFVAVYFVLHWLLWPLARLIYLVATTPMEEGGRHEYEPVGGARQHQQWQHEHSNF